MQGTLGSFSVTPAQLAVGADGVAALEFAFAPLKAGAAACSVVLRCDDGQLLSYKLAGTGAPACIACADLCLVTSERRSLTFHMQAATVCTICECSAPSSLAHRRGSERGAHAH